VVFNAGDAPILPAGPPGAPTANAPQSPYYEEERIEIPGTHVPAWVVVILVLGVILLLIGTAFLFLH
jgi:hypothetical protein